MLTTQNFGIMSTFKSTAATAIAILVLAALLLSIQSKRMAETKAELARLEARTAELDPSSRHADRDRSRRKPASVRELVHSGRGDRKAIFGDLLSAFMEQDQTAMTFALSSLGPMDAARYAELLAAAREYPGSDGARRILLGILAPLAPADARQGEIESLIAGNQGPAATAILCRWAEDDPGAAMRWFIDKKANSQLFGTAVEDRTEIHMLASLLTTLTRVNPTHAVSLYTQLALTPSEGWEHATEAIAKAMGELLAEGKGSAEFNILLATADAKTRQALVAEAARHALPQAGLDDYAGFVGEHLANPSEAHELVVDRIVSSGGSPEAQLADARRLMPGMDETMAISRIVKAHAEDIKATRQWVDGLPAGANRDAGLLEVSRLLAFSYQNFNDSYETAKRIADPAARDQMMQAVAIRWMERKPDTARTTLPPEVLRNLPVE